MPRKTVIRGGGILDAAYIRVQIKHVPTTAGVSRVLSYATGNGEKSMAHGQRTNNVGDRPTRM